MPRQEEPGTVIKTLLVISFVVLSLVTYAMRLHVQQSARYLKSASPRRANDGRLEMPKVTINPVPDFEILTSTEKDLPKSVSGAAKVFRILFIAMIANAIALLFLFS
jgi:hypothetical protein